MITYPTSLDTLTNPSAADNLDTTGVLHDVQHSDVNDAVEALEAKVGITNSADSSSLDYVTKRSVGPRSTVTYAATVNIDMDGYAYQFITLTGDLLLGTNSGSRSSTLVKTVNVVLDPGASNRSITFATGVNLLNYSNPPAAITLLASKKAIVTLISTGTAETATIAAYAATS